MSQRNDVDFAFDANGVEPAKDVSEPMPNGWYRMQIESTDYRPTKSGGGRFLELVWTVLDGEYKGRKVWDTFNVVNENEQAVEIAKAQLSAVCHATGVLRFQSHQQLRAKTALVRVVIKHQDGYSSKNEAKAYKADDAGAGVASTRQPFPARVPNGMPPGRPIAAVAEDDDSDLPF